MTIKANSLEIRRVITRLELTNSVLDVWKIMGLMERDSIAVLYKAGAMPGTLTLHWERCMDPECLELRARGNAMSAAA